MATTLTYTMKQYSTTYGSGTCYMILTYDGNASSCKFYLGAKKTSNSYTEYYYDGYVDYSLNGGAWTTWVTLNSSSNSHTMYFNETNNTNYYAATVGTSVRGITDYTKSGVVNKTLTNIGTVSFRVRGRRSTDFFLWYVRGQAWYIPNNTTVFTINFGGVRVYSGGWKLALPYVYSGGWKLALPYTYSGGWKIST